MNEGLLNEKEAQAALRVSRKTLYRWRKAGIIKSIKYGTRLHRYPISEIERVQREGV